MPAVTAPPSKPCATCGEPWKDENGALPPWHRKVPDSPGLYGLRKGLFPRHRYAPETERT